MDETAILAIFDSIPQSTIEKLSLNLICRLSTSFITSHDFFAKPFIEAGLISREAYQIFCQKNKDGNATFNTLSKPTTLNTLSKPAKPASETVPVDSNRLRRIIENLRCDCLNDSSDSLWESTQTVLANNASQDPVKRYHQLEAAETNLNIDNALLSYRRRMLRVLQCDELQIFKNIGKTQRPTTVKARQNKPTCLSNKELAAIFEIKEKSMKCKLTQHKKYISLCEDFGLGSLEALGDYPQTCRDWERITTNELLVLKIYIWKYRPDWVQFVVSRNKPVARRLADGMRRNGMLETAIKHRSNVMLLMCKYITPKDDEDETHEEGREEGRKEGMEDKRKWREKIPGDILEMLERIADKIHNNDEETTETSEPSDNNDEETGVTGELSDNDEETGVTGELSDNNDEPEDPSEPSGRRTNPRLNPEPIGSLNDNQTEATTSSPCTTAEETPGASLSLQRSEIDKRETQNEVSQQSQVNGCGKRPRNPEQNQSEKRPRMNKTLNDFDIHGWESQLQLNVDEAVNDFEIHVDDMVNDFEIHGWESQLQLNVDDMVNDFEIHGWESQLQLNVDEAVNDFEIHVDDMVNDFEIHGWESQLQLSDLPQNATDEVNNTHAPRMQNNNCCPSREPTKTIDDILDDANRDFPLPILSS